MDLLGERYRRVIASCKNIFFQPLWRAQLLPGDGETHVAKDSEQRLISKFAGDLDTIDRALEAFGRGTKVSDRGRTSWLLSSTALLREVRSRPICFLNMRATFPRNTSRDLVVLYQDLYRSLREEKRYQRPLGHLVTDSTPYSVVSWTLSHAILSSRWSSPIQSYGYPPVGDERRLSLLPAMSIGLHGERKFGRFRT